MRIFGHTLTLTTAPTSSALVIGLSIGSLTINEPSGSVDSGLSPRFDRDIRPVLADKCFKCHGPDASSRQAGLRLDTAEGATALLASGRRAIVPGDVDQSELMHRITASDPADRMPPRDSHKSVMDGEVEMIRRWIEAGAKWEGHWSFEPIRDYDVPVHSESWGRNAIDAFILDRMKQEELTPSPPAARERILRRVTLDLTGLPPTLDEIDAFLRDDSPDAYDRVVDRLLASPRFGEHFAVSWLDIARYADSYGYQSDQLSPTWPYRDWLVRAMNRNLPYDEFIVHQLAGDLVPGSGREEKLATAFNRLHRMTNEGGSIEEEFRVEYAADRTRTMGTAFMGLTLECARCHDHKFDPISTRDYYGLFAFFNNIDEWGMYHDSSRVPTPSLLLPTDEQQEAIREATEALQSCNVRLTDLRRERETAFEAWYEKRGNRSVTFAGLAGHYLLDEIAGENQLENDANPDKPGSSTPANSIIAGRDGGALRFTGDDAATFPSVAGGLQPWNPFSVSFWIRIPANLEDAIVFHQSGGTDVGRHGTELSLKEGRLFFGIMRFWPGNAIAIQSRTAVPTEEWVHVVATYDASGRAAGLRLYLNGHAADSVTLRDNLTKSPGAAGHGITFGERFRDAGLKDAAIDDVYVFGREIAPIEAATLYDSRVLADVIATCDINDARAFYFAGIDEEVAGAIADRSTALRALLDARDPVIEIPVMEELPEIRPAHVLARGEYDAPRTPENQVSRLTPEALPPFGDETPPDRLGLARWLTRPDHPLTARVAVNRFWQHFFGRGLVLTSEDFGVQGSRPSHPKLLDFLARSFVESGWDLKQLCRQIVSSATYRQDSALRPDLDASDPDNILLARGPSRRLSAEVLRDLCLAASGLLDETRGGPPVSPYQPTGLWREANTMSPAYRQGVGTSLYRRSLYSVWKRTSPLPNMIAFDAATREGCTARRQETNTPVQALVLLNDPQFVEAARVLADRALNHAAAEKERISYVFRLLTGRLPTEEEASVLVELLLDQRQVYSADPQAAKSLLDTGEAPRDEGVDPIETAALTVLVQAIMNTDATVWQR